MPTIVQGTEERTVSQAEYEALVQRTERAFRVHSEGGPKLTVYNQVDGSSMNVAVDQAKAFYLQMDVARCSVCRYTSSRNLDVANHIQRVQEQAVAHRMASLEDEIVQGEPRQRCTACGSRYRIHKGQAHLDTALRDGPLHVRAEVQRILLYGLTPPRLEDPPPAQVEDSTGSEARSERSPVRRHRRRGRGKKGNRA